MFQSMIKFESAKQATKFVESAEPVISTGAEILILLLVISIAWLQFRRPSSI